MSQKLRITRDDLLRGKVIDPTWYDCQVMKHTEEAAKTDGSLNHNIELKVLSGPFAGVPLYRVFNEKSPGFAVRFIEALGGKIDPEKGGEFDLDKSVGQKLKVYVKNELYNGTMRNRVEDFMPIGA